MSLETKSDPARRTFVLVHGAWHGGWCWTRVASRLRALGHQVFTPTLTGLGERAHLRSPGIDLSVHVADVVNLLRCEELEDVTLCGHSYGGLVITGVAAQVGAALHGVVYLDAFAPPDGQSLLESLPAEMAGLLQSWEHDGQIAAPPAAMMTQRAADAAWIQRRMTPQPAATLKQAVTGGAAVEAVARKVFVLADGQQSVFPLYAARITAAPGWRLAHVAGGHDLMIDAPDEVTRILLEVAE